MATKWNACDEQFLKENYNAQNSAFIKDALPYSWNSILNKANKLGLSLDHNFFNKPGQINSYVAGFIAADGCVSSSRNRIEIVTHKSDLEHLETMRSLFRSFNKIGHRDDGTVRIAVSSAQWVQDLRDNYSIVPNKSLILEQPKITGVSCIKSFIAGYIDGDGHIGYKTSRNSNWSYLRIQICGTKALLEWINDNLPVKGSIRPKENIHSFEIGGLKAFEMYNYLWNPTLPILERKWNKNYKTWSPKKELIAV